MHRARNLAAGAARRSARSTEPLYGCIILGLIACNKEDGTAGRTDRKVTVYDIARKLNMSASTVSRVLNNSNLVGIETRERIIRVANEMGYHKRTIRRHRRRAILNVALFLPFGTDNHLHLFYDTAELVHALDSGFGDVRANIISVVNGPSVRLFDHKKMGDIDACVFGFTSPSPELLDVIDSRDIPVVLINRIDSRRNYVVSDHAAGMELLLDELIRANPDVRPCYLGFPVVPQVSELRHRGLLKAARRRGIDFGGGDVRNFNAISEIAPRQIEALLQRGYDALVCFNDVMAVYTYQCALHMGLRIPDDFSLTGFDNSPVRSLISDPVLTVDLAVPELGYQAGKWLRETIIDKTDASLRLHVPGRLIAGTTIGRPRRRGRAAAQAGGAR